MSQMNEDHYFLCFFAFLFRFSVLVFTNIFLPLYLLQGDKGVKCAAKLCVKQIN